MASRIELPLAALSASGRTGGEAPTGTPSPARKQAAVHAVLATITPLSLLVRTNHCPRADVGQVVAGVAACG